MYKRNNLTDFQKHLIVFLNKDMGLEPGEIKKDARLLRSDGKMMQTRTVKYWLDRYNLTGDTNSIKPTGRKRCLDVVNESKLMKYIEDNNEMFYSEVKATTGLSCTARTINNYALRNKISKIAFKCFYCKLIDYILFHI